MEATPEGLAVAAATREAAKKKRVAEEAAADKKPEPKKPHLNRPPPTATHEVAVPKGFDPNIIELDPEVYGAEAEGGHALAWRMGLHGAWTCMAHGLAWRIGLRACPHPPSCMAHRLARRHYGQPGVHRQVREGVPL
jgi:hypothetical protein